MSLGLYTQYNLYCPITDIQYIQMPPPPIANHTLLRYTDQMYSRRYAILSFTLDKKETVSQWKYSRYKYSPHTCSYLIKKCYHNIPSEMSYT